jgi:hypothetical protein
MSRDYKRFLKKKSLFSYYLASFFLVSNSASGEVLSNSQFEVGAREYPWTSFTNVEISNLSQHNAGQGQGLQFFFEGGGSNDDSFAEARFSLDKAYTNLVISFDMYIPGNYVHRNSENNKFFRLWLNEYGDIEKVGASLRGNDGGSLIGTDYSLQPGWGTSTTVKSKTGFITDADKGKWTDVKLEVVAPSDSSMGSITIYKNGQLFLKDESVPNLVPGQQGYQKGYLLGWANSGFSTDTYVLIDNVIFSDGETVAAPPSPPTLEIGE